MKTTVKAPAKINLFLEIVSKRPDGYHNIVTLMHPVPLYDIVTVETGYCGSTELSCSCPDIPSDKSNLAWQASDAFFKISGIENTGVKIRIEKNIPMKAGLAGGSTDAAAVLNALNTLYGTPLDKDKLTEAAAMTGADVPFCLFGQPMLCKGIGDILIPSPRLPDCFIVISKPKTGMQTEKAYFLMDKLKKRSVNNADYLAIMTGGDLEKICSFAYNCFEAVFPPDENICKAMSAEGALTVRLSGSGSAVFGIFDREDNARSAFQKLCDDGFEAYFCDMRDQ